MHVSLKSEGRSKTPISHANKLLQWCVHLYIQSLKKSARVGQERVNTRRAVRKITSWMGTSGVECGRIAFWRSFAIITTAIHIENSIQSIF